MTQILLILTIVLPLAYSPFFLPFGFESAFVLKRVLLELGALSLTAAYCIGINSVRGFTRVSLKIFLPVLYVGYLGLHSLWLGQGDISSKRFYEAVCLLVIFLAASRSFRNPKDVRRLFQCLCTGGALAAVWGIVQAVLGIEPYSTLGNRNFFASTMLLVIPAGALLMIWAARERKWGTVILYVGVLVLALMSMVLCKSKAAWLALAGIAVLCLRKYYWIGAAFLVGAALFLSLGPIDGVMRELSQDVRPYLWQGALNMGLSNPLFGKGLGQFFIHVPWCRSPEYFLMGKSADTTLHAHNEYLEIFAETGLIGLLLFLAMVYANLRDLLALARQKGSSGIPLALGAILIAILIKNFFDMDLRTACSAFLFWLVLGAGAAQTTAAVLPDNPMPFRWVLKVAGPALAAYLFLHFTLPLVRAEFLLKAAANEEFKGRWTNAEAYYEKAMVHEPGLPEIPFRLGYACIQSGQWDKALSAYERVRFIAPFYSNVVFNMAAVWRQKGDYNQAMRYLREGFALNPYSLSGHDIAREIFALTGQVRKARREEQILGMIQSRRQKR